MNNLPSQAKSQTAPLQFQNAFWVFFIILISLISGYLIATNPLRAGLIAATALLILLLFKKPTIGIYIALLLPVFGEFGRISSFTTLSSLSGNGVLISDVFISAFIGVWIIKKISEPRTQPKTEPKSCCAPINVRSKNPLLKPLMFFSIIGILSLLQSLLFLQPNEVLSSSLYLVRFIEYALLAIITTEIITSPKQKKRAVAFIIIAVLLIAIAGFIQLIIYPDLGKLEELGWDPHQNRLVSTWLDPNFIGGLLAFVMMIIISLGLYSKKLLKKIGFVVVLAIMGVALFLTYSRSAYVAFTAGLLFIGIFKSRKLLIAGILIAAVALSFSIRAQERVNDLSHSITSFIFNTSENPDATSRLRIQSWQQTLQLIQKRPLLGSGYNTLRYVKFNEGFVDNTDVHSASGSDSSILTILATTGIIGLIPFLILYFNLLKLAWKNWREKFSSNFEKALGLGIFSGILSLLVHSLFVNSLLFAQIAIFLWISAGLLKINKD